MFDPSTPATALLAEDEPAPYQVMEGEGRSPYVVVCDHAGRKLPRALGSLGLAERDLERHIAWDIGAGALSRYLAQELGAWSIVQTYSRLVIDCNRPLTSPDSIAQQSEDTQISGNLGLSSEQAELRARHIFEPYHARIRQELDERQANGRSAVLLLVHSFTPTFRGVARPWHAGILYHRDTRLALPLLHALKRDLELTIGENQPYAVSPQSDYGIIEHAERRGLVHAEIEVRQDQLADEAGQKVWAARLARLLEETVPGCV